MREILIGSVECDYMTLTSYDKRTRLRLENQLEQIIKGRPRKSARRMQYEGWSSEGVFSGVAVQRGVLHYMAVASGIEAAYLLSRMQALAGWEQASCTRIDLQFTRPRFRSDDALSTLGKLIREELQRNVKEDNKRPKVQIIDKEGIYDETVYIGSRKSDRYMRIYDKPQAEELYIRIETEFKGQLAEMVFRSCLSNDRAPREFMKREIRDIWQAGSIIETLWYELVSERAMKAKVLKDHTDDTSRLLWLEETLMPLVRKLGLGKYRSEALFILQRAIEELQDL